ncbi:potassium voltage-gated channel subfamily S member 2-like [Mytilus californianus]|uniref:potassium voltage-gated channel subfamily S member 2-like n=1 Tax=Mytilus californianus TaxID=6549 RepID=UPI002248311D|nr:potassium voltage-gated channel subfamily S member 2-like [Mytilus californianus]
MDRFFINVSGTKFEISKAALLTQPDTRLGKIALSTSTSEKQELYFDRPATAFESILTFYQTRKLHMPPNVCPNSFKEDLDYWQIDYEYLDKCCLYSFIQFLDLHTARIEFQYEKNETLSKTVVSKCSAMRNRIWKVIDYHEATLLAKLYLIVGITIVLLSVGVLALSTLSTFRSPVPLCEAFKYMSFGEAECNIATAYADQDCNKLKVKYKEDESYMYYMDPSFYDDDQTNHNESLKQKFEQFLARNHTGVTQKSKIFVKIDHFFTAFFTAEFLLRLFVCPNVKSFFTSILNLIELFILVGTYVVIAISNSKLIPTCTDLMSVIEDFMDFVKMIRVIRLLRYCQNLAAVRVLTFSIKKNVKDLFLLFFHISLIVLIFGNIVYLSEDRHNIDSIPHGWWLGVITITTVGFGDVVPTSVTGKIICSACALCGILTLALITSIFVETFMSLYGVALIDAVPKEDRIRKWDHYSKKIRENGHSDFIDIKKTKI